MVHYYMYKKTNKINTDKQTNALLLNSQPNKQMCKQTNKLRYQTYRKPITKNPSLLSTPPLKKRKKKKQAKIRQTKRQMFH